MSEAGGRSPRHIPPPPYYLKVNAWAQLFERWLALTWG